MTTEGLRQVIDDWGAYFNLERRRKAGTAPLKQSGGLFQLSANDYADNHLMFLASAGD